MPQCRNAALTGPFSARRSYAVFLEHVVARDSPQCTVAAELVHRIDDYRQAFFDDRLEPETMAGQRPLDMTQFVRLWTSERVPGVACDAIRLLAPADHVVVIAKRQFFKVATRAAHGGARLSPAALRVQFERCLAMASGADRDGDGDGAAAAGVGALTAGDRTRWAHARAELEQHAVNRATLQVRACRERAAQSSTNQSPQKKRPSARPSTSSCSTTRRRPRRTSSRCWRWPATRACAGSTKSSA